MSNRTLAGIACFLALTAFAPPAARAQAPSFLLQWGSLGDGPGQFSAPQGVATDAAGNVYVSDIYFHRIQKFDGSGTYLGEWDVTNQCAPAVLAVGANGIVYVADVYGRIRKYTTAGVFLGQWGSPGGAPGYFSSPGGVATDAAGNVYVADSGNSRVQKFTSNGVYLTEWGYEGTADGLFSYASDVVV